MEITKDEFDQANASMKEMQSKSGTVTSASFDPSTRNVVLQLSTGIGIFFSPEDAQGLEHATAEQLSEIEISPSGLGLHFPQLDADLWVPSLLEGVLGSRKWMAARLGAAGGSKTSTAKAAAARANGSLGGRPRAPQPGRRTRLNQVMFRRRSG